MSCFGNNLWVSVVSGPWVGVGGWSGEGVEGSVHAGF